jgi:hypothetical protein
MAEKPGAYKTDSQKTSAFRDTKFREIPAKRKLRSLPVFGSSLALPVFWRLALASQP